VKSQKTNVHFASVNRPHQYWFRGSISRQAPKSVRERRTQRVKVQLPRGLSAVVYLTARSSRLSIYRRSGSAVEHHPGFYLARTHRVRKESQCPFVLIQGLRYPQFRRRNPEASLLQLHMPLLIAMIKGLGIGYDSKRSPIILSGTHITSTVVTIGTNTLNGPGLIVWINNSGSIAA
jgi:hypothetical protein